MMINDSDEVPLDEVLLDEEETHLDDGQFKADAASLAAPFRNPPLQAALVPAPAPEAQAPAPQAQPKNAAPALPPPALIGEGVVVVPLQNSAAESAQPQPLLQLEVGAQLPVAVGSAPAPPGDLQPGVQPGVQSGVKNPAAPAGDAAPQPVPQGAEDGKKPPHPRYIGFEPISKSALRRLEVAKQALLQFNERNEMEEGEKAELLMPSTHLVKKTHDMFKAFARDIGYSVKRRRCTDDEKAMTDQKRLKRPIYWTSVTLIDADAADDAPEAASNVPVKQKSPRVPTPYELFVKQNSATVLRVNPTTSAEDISRIFVLLWERADKAPYEAEAQRLRHAGAAFPAPVPAHAPAPAPAPAPAHAHAAPASSSSSSAAASVVKATPAAAAAGMGPGYTGKAPTAPASSSLSSSSSSAAASAAKAAKAGKGAPAPARAAFSSSSSAAPPATGHQGKENPSAPAKATSKGKGREASLGQMFGKELALNTSRRGGTLRESN